LSFKSNLNTNLGFICSENPFILSFIIYPLSLAIFLNFSSSTKTSGSNNTAIALFSLAILFISSFNFLKSSLLRLSYIGPLETYINDPEKLNLSD